MIVLKDNNYIKVECPRCKSLLGVHLADITYNEMAHRGPVYSASCGACGAQVGVPERDMPRGWVAALVDE